ncbi:hypothetical protein ScPMuIL_013104 [Solemya velum]
MANDDNRGDSIYMTEHDINSATVTQLKQYLRRHNQYVSGNKKDLISRAKGVRKLNLDDVQDRKSEAEEKFARRQTDKLVTPLGEILPDPKTVTAWTTDLNNIPDFTEGDIYNYFVLKMKTKRQLRSKVYYEDRHVHSVKYHDGVDKDCSHCFVKCQVIPSIPTTNSKKKPDHDVWICLSKVTGQVHSADCDCIAGSGEACNHVGAFMYALCDLTRKKKEGKLSSTSIKCKWNNPRKRKPSPKKSSDLTFKKYKFEQSSPAPRMKTLNNASQITCTFNEESFRKNLQLCNPRADWLRNFVTKRTEQPIIAEFLDINFQYQDLVNLSDNTIQNEIEEIFKKMTMTSEETEALEKLTRGQNKNPRWSEERSKRITASNFGTIVNKKDSTKPDGIIRQMLYTTLNNRYVNWGKKHEPAAIMKYRLTMKKKLPRYQSVKLWVNGQT